MLLLAVYRLTDHASTEVRSTGRDRLAQKCIDALSKLSLRLPCSRHRGVHAAEDVLDVVVGTRAEHAPVMHNARDDPGGREAVSCSRPRVLGDPFFQLGRARQPRANGC